jgi:hypothetical protein
MVNPMIKKPAISAKMINVPVLNAIPLLESILFTDEAASFCDGHALTPVNLPVYICDYIIHICTGLQTH